MRIATQLANSLLTPSRDSRDSGDSRDSSDTQLRVAEAFAVSDTPFEQVCLKLRGPALALYLDKVCSKFQQRDEVKVVALQLKLCYTEHEGLPEFLEKFQPWPPIAIEMLSEVGLHELASAFMPIEEKV